MTEYAECNKAAVHDVPTQLVDCESEQEHSSHIIPALYIPLFYI